MQPSDPRLPARPATRHAQRAHGAPDPAPSPQLVLFDLDGTLIDTAPELSAAVNAACMERGYPPAPAQVLRPYAGMGGTRMLHKALCSAGLGDDEAAGLAKALVPRFLAHYATGLGTRLAHFEGMSDALRALRTQGVRWGVVTNKPHRLAELTLYACGHARECAILLGAGVSAWAKPAPHPLRLAAARMGACALRTWYVGDDERDVVAARAAGMYAIAAAWGYIAPGTTPGAWGAATIASAPQDLTSLLHATLEQGPGEQGPGEQGPGVTAPEGGGPARYNND